MYVWAHMYDMQCVCVFVYTCVYVDDGSGCVPLIMKVVV